MSRRQLRDLGLGDAAIARWLAERRILPVHRGVYALGHLALGIEGRLHAALLYGGRGSALSHTTAAWWWGIEDREPHVIDVATRINRRAQAGLRIRLPRTLARVGHRGLPVTPPARTLLDVASVVPRPRLRRLLAEAEFRRLVDPRELVHVLGRGRPGSTALRAAIEEHLPELAKTLSVLEEGFFDLCRRAALPLPEVNVTVAGLMVDALWRDRRLVVELDGHQAHALPSAIERDRRRELALRAAGYGVVRYTWAQVTGHPEAVITDLRRVLAPN